MRASLPRPPGAPLAVATCWRSVDTTHFTPRARWVSVCPHAPSGGVALSAHLPSADLVVGNMRTFAGPSARSHTASTGIGCKNAPSDDTMAFTSAARAPVSDTPAGMSTTRPGAPPSRYGDDATKLEKSCGDTLCHRASDAGNESKNSSPSDTTSARRRWMSRGSGPTARTGSTIIVTGDGQAAQLAGAQRQ